jgi:hypothetical protein
MDHPPPCDNLMQSAWNYGKDEMKKTDIAKGIGPDDLGNPFGNHTSTRQPPLRTSASGLNRK